MKRREFITLVGGAAAMPVLAPFTARAQQPTIGFLGLGFSNSPELSMAGFHQGLSEAGFVDGRNVRIEYRWAEGQFARLPALAGDLARLRPDVIYVGSPPGVRAAIGATTTTPIVFGMGEDPVKEGIVANLNRPGGRVTGVTGLTNQLVGKRLQLLHEITSGAATFAFLINPNNPNGEPDSADARVTAQALGRQLHVVGAAAERELATAFDAMAQLRVGALSVNADPSFRAWREPIVALAARHAIPAAYERPEFVSAGGLMAYSADQVDAARQGGIYVGRILKGEKAGDLPVLQSTKFELVINLKTAQALGLTIPPGVLAIADKVIE